MADRIPLGGGSPIGQRSGGAYARPMLTRRTKIVGAGLIAAATLAIGFAAVGWYFYLPHHRPALQEGERYGVDVSNHQGVIDWQAVADDDIDFAYIKSTEGGDFVDVFFERNWDQARAAGLEVGAYHFFTFCTPGDAQAANVLSVVPLDEMDLPLALDLEFGGNCSARPTRTDMAAEVNEFIEIVEAATDEEVVLYIGEKFDAAYELKDALDRELWERRLWRRPNVDNWTFWQWSYRAHVNGIDGGVDLNTGRPARA